MEHFMQFLLENSAKSAVLAVLVWIVCLAFSRKISPRWKYFLWALVAARLVMPNIFPTKLSASNIIYPKNHTFPEIYRDTNLPVNDYSKTNYVPTKNTMAIENLTEDKPVAKTTAKHSPEPVTQRKNILREFSINSLIFAIWGAGFVFLCGIVFYRNLKFYLLVRKEISLPDQELIKVLDECQKSMNCNFRIKLVSTKMVKTPAVTGIIHPSLLIPEKMKNFIQINEIRYIFMHELAHLKRKDLLVNWIIVIIQSIYWFNPLAWHVFKKMREEREHACDELVLNIIGYKENRNYGNMIVRLLEFPSPSSIYNTIGILENKEQIKRRIEMIKNFRPARYQLLAATFSVGFGVFFLSDASPSSTLISTNNGSKIEERNQATDLTKKFIAGIKCKSEQERRGIWRSMGIDLSDSEFEAAEAEADKEKGSWKKSPIPSYYHKDIAILKLSNDEFIDFMTMQEPIFIRWVNKDPQKALAFAKDILQEHFVSHVGFAKNTPYRYGQARPNDLLISLSAEWARKDIKQAQAWADSQQKGAARWAAIQGIAIAMSEKDPEGAIALIEKEKMPVFRDGLIYNVGYYLFTQWGSQNRNEAIAHISKLSGDNGFGWTKSAWREWAYDAISEQWAKEDLQGAIKWAESLPTKSGIKYDTLGNIIRTVWALKNPVAARNYTQTAWEKDEKDDPGNQKIWSLFESWTEKDPESFANWLIHLPVKTKEQKERIEHNLWGFCRSWAFKDVNAVQKWTENLPEGYLRNSAENGIFDYKAIEIVRNTKTFKDGLAEIEKLPQKYQNNALVNLASAWGNGKNFEELYSWIQTLPPEKKTDGLLWRSATSGTGYYPERAELAIAIRGESRQKQVVGDIVDRWINVDRQVALEWVQKSALPDKIKARWIDEKK